MTTEAIYQKYATTIAAVTGDGSWIDWGVMRLALRLAIADAHDAGLQTCAGMANDLAAITANQEKALQSALEQVDQLREERNQALAAFQTIDEQLAQVDAGNADLTKRCGSLRIELAEVMESRDHWLDQLAAVTEQRDAAQREIDRLTRENVIAVDIFNTLQEPAIHTNGNVPSRPAPTDWHVFLDEEANDWRISLDAGRRRFADIPKLARLRIIQAILRGTQIDTGNTAAMPTMADYDAVRPPWAPVASGVAKTFGCGWRDVLDLTEVPE